MKNSRIQMRKTSSLTNPARNSVLQCESDSLLNTYLREISGCATLSADEEKEVARKAKAGDIEAKKQLVQANLKLVITIAARTG